MPASLSDRSALPTVIISDLSDFADDNIAILMLLNSGKFDVRAVIATSGNVCAERSAAEGRRFLDAAGASDIPVVQGFPLERHAPRIGYYENVERSSPWPPAFAGALASKPRCTASRDGKAADPANFLIQLARATAGDLTVILIGPATVLAEAVMRDARIASHIRQVFAMGGAIKVTGNATRYAEFNVWFDPEAMATLFASDVPLTLVPLDSTDGVTYAQRPAPQGNTETGFSSSYLASFLERRGAQRRPVAMWDEVVAAIAIDPMLVETAEELVLGVSLEKDARYGMTLPLPEASTTPTRRVRVVTRVDADGVRRVVDQQIRSGE